MMTSYIWLAVSVAAVCHVQTSVGSAPSTTASEGPTSPSTADEAYGSIAFRQRLGKNWTPTCNLDPKATMTLTFLTDDVANVRKSVRSSETRLVAMNTLLNVIKDKVLALSEEDVGKPSLEDVVAGLRANLSAFVSEQVSAGQEVQEDNRQAIGGLTTRTSDLDVRVHQLEEQLTALAGQLTKTVDRLESEKAALQAKLADLEGKITAKRCETGALFFKPYDKPSVTDANGGITRTHTRSVTFSTPFTSLPKVTAGFSSLDASNSKNLRVSTTVSDLTTSGFDLSVSEWADSQNFGVTVSWMACSL